MKTCLAAILLSSAAWEARAQIAPDPTRLPGDLPPPPLAVLLHPPTNRPLEPADTTPAPPMALALEAAQAAIAACAVDHLRIGVAVTDAAGQLRVGLTAEGVAPGAIYHAVRKDLAAITFRAPTSEVQARFRSDPATPGLESNMTVNPGAVPLIVDDRVIGAIGASGATAQQDEACASAGAARIKDRLK